jgi:pimeloyl-ACP methyl ester carboxylesterase
VKPRAWRRIAVAAVVAAGTVAVVVRPALAADNPYQRGPDPTAASVPANRGTFATAQVVVIGIDTNGREDWDTARGMQLLAALDYLTQRSSVRDRVDASRTAVMGHSMGGGGAMSAALRRHQRRLSIRPQRLLQRLAAPVRVDDVRLHRQRHADQPHTHLRLTPGDHHAFA